MSESIMIGNRRVSLSIAGDGAPLLCLPGGPGFPGAQLGELGGVSRTRALLRVDWRGAGESDPPSDGRFGVADFVADLEAIQDALDLDKIALFGHSFGGLVAAQYAAVFPDRVSHLILDGTPNRLDDGRAPEGGAAGYFATWGESPERYLEQIMSDIYEPAGAWFEANEFSRCDLDPILPRISAKTLIITGDQDWASGPVRAGAMTDSIPDAQLAVIAHAGHFAWVEQPDAYAHAVAQFLDGT